IGKNGQTARALAAAADGSFELIQAGSAEADLRDDRSLATFVERAKPDVLINAGAYNFVDKAETEEKLTLAINASGRLALATLCRQRGIGFIHMSTDCVFDGLGNQPHIEDEEPTPISAYGAPSVRAK